MDWNLFGITFAWYWFIKHCCVSLGLIYILIRYCRRATNGGAYLEKKYFNTNYSSTDQIQLCIYWLYLLKLENIIKRTWQPTYENCLTL